MKRLEGALKLLECILELAKTVIWCYTSFKNKVLDLYASTTRFEGVFDAFENVFGQSQRFFKRLEGALKRLECVLELAKTMILCYTSVTNQILNLHASTTPFEGVLDAFENVFEILKGL